ncbi:hypothetical protein A2819_00270 [Candidatus Azambacteria bacterium RIFCSPHIGHO2_01_FULL_40_24]|uniref:Glycosyltransferase subfamily 4-like N-terminal domain-containing protein n=1 Tax=Candidatus Azambacteria bacterium RIFCSPHIGHO2_01_FULL_40_24 TaxID=1797301 RepID=A0A1F5B416_9BACT|nr:MAG: hypothetical protein A2819_00270 [Candidatus Azambacteria bacterium RIFCSPHIGHO2_01_FULL_40_24]
MRIARIIEYFPPHIGGMERHGLILSQEQTKLGYDAEIFIGVGDRSLFKKTFQAPFQFLPLYSKMRRFWFNFWAMRQVIKRHKKNPYDIIHLHGDFMEAYFGGKLSKKLNIPVVITIHAGLNKRLLKPKNAKYFKNISKIICVSNEIYKDLKIIGVSEIKFEVISSGIDLSEFKSIDKNKIITLQHQYSKPVIISVGVLRINKGFRYLIESFKEVKEKFNTATLIIIGDGPDKNELETQAKNIGNIYFLSRQSHDKVIEHLKAADVFVLASISTVGDREGTPTVIMEAMAAGLPVIATNVGGVADLIENRKNGFIVDQGQAEKLAMAIIELINNPDLIQKMIAQNLEDIKTKDWPTIARRIDDVYKSIL